MCPSKKRWKRLACNGVMEQLGAGFNSGKQKLLDEVDSEYVLGTFTLEKKMRFSEVESDNSFFNDILGDVLVFDGTTTQLGLAAANGQADRAQ